MVMVMVIMILVSVACLLACLAWGFRTPKLVQGHCTLRPVYVTACVAGRTLDPADNKITVLARVAPPWSVHALPLPDPSLAELRP
jgi:hypothetical protein